MMPAGGGDGAGLTPGRPSGGRAGGAAGHPAPPGAGAAGARRLRAPAAPDTPPASTPERPEPLKRTFRHLRLADLERVADLGGAADGRDDRAVALVRQATGPAHEARLGGAAADPVVQAG